METTNPTKDDQMIWDKMRESLGKGSKARRAQEYLQGARNFLLENMDYDSVAKFDETLLAISFEEWTNPKSRYYDKALHDELRKIRPSWFWTVIEGAQS